MGTRNLILVYYKGQYLIAQYGQWDGFPEGQGVDVLAFISDPRNRSKLRAVLDAAEIMLYEPSDDQVRAWQAEMVRVSNEYYAMTNELKDTEATKASWVTHPGQEVCPSISRDTGAGILRIVADATEPVPILKHISFIKQESCEWAYVVDLDVETFEVYTHWNGFEAISQPAERRSRFNDVEELRDATSLPSMVARFSLNSLPSKIDFLNGLEAEDVD